MRHVMPKNSLTMLVLRLRRKLKTDGVSSGLEHQIISSVMNKNGETLNYKWASYVLNLILKRAKCHRKCQLGTCHLLCYPISSVEHKISKRYWDLVKQKQCK